MKKISLIIIGLALSQLSFTQSMEDFIWLEGTWKRQNVSPGKAAYETWEKTTDGLDGLGVSMQGNDTTFVEQLSILSKDGELYYVANVSSNGAPTYFRIISASQNGFIAENPQHDFPKKIEYSLEGKKLTAIISAGEKAIGFVFVKKK